MKTEQQGKIIRISAYMLKFLDSKRKQKESYDAALRRLFGKRSIRRKKQRAPKTFFVVMTNESSGYAYFDKATARGQAIVFSISSNAGPFDVIEAKEVI